MGIGPLDVKYYGGVDKNHRHYLKKRPVAGSPTTQYDFRVPEHPYGRHTLAQSRTAPWSLVGKMNGVPTTTAYSDLGINRQEKRVNGLWQHDRTMSAPILLIHSLKMIIDSSLFLCEFRN